MGHSINGDSVSEAKATYEADLLDGVVTLQVPAKEIKQKMIYIMK